MVSPSRESAGFGKYSTDKWDHIARFEPIDKLVEAFQVPIEPVTFGELLAKIAFVKDLRAARLAILLEGLIVNCPVARVETLIRDQDAFHIVGFAHAHRDGDRTSHVRLSLS